MKLFRAIYMQVFIGMTVLTVGMVFLLLSAMMRQSLSDARQYGEEALRNNTSALRESVQREQKLKREAEEYLPLPLIASCTGHRYVYSDSRTEVTLSKKLSVCRFQVYRDEVQLLDGVTEKLSGAVKAQGDCPYLSEEDARQYFDCEAEYIDGTEYGICLGPKESRLVTSIEETIREGRN